MSNSTGSISVFAIVKAPATNVVCAAHPTEAINPNYRPPFKHKFIKSSGDERGDRSLQLVGTASKQEDGTIRVDLTDDPLSRTLIIKNLP